MNMVPCPHCGEEINERAKFCRHCGSSDSDGWSEDAEGHAYGDDFDDADYDDFVEENFQPHRLTDTQTPTLWRAVVVFLLILGLLSSTVIFSLSLF